MGYKECFARSKFDDKALVTITYVVITKQFDDFARVTQWCACKTFKLKSATKTNFFIMKISFLIFKYMPNTLEIIDRSIRHKKLFDCHSIDDGVAFAHIHFDIYTTLF